jgi:hypothetical protein
VARIFGVPSHVLFAPHDPSPPSLLPLNPRGGIGRGRGCLSHARPSALDAGAHQLGGCQRQVCAVRRQDGEGILTDSFLTSASLGACIFWLDEFNPRPTF